MLPDFQKARILQKKAIDNFLQARVSTYFPGLSQIPVKPLKEGNKLTSSFSEDKNYEHEFKTVDSSGRFEIDKIILNPGYIFQVLDEMAQEFALKQKKIIYNSLSDIADQHGSSIKVDGTITPTHFLNMLEKITINFNKDGLPILPSYITEGKMQEEINKAMEDIEQDSQLRKQYDYIILKQKINWRDRENNRKLVG